MIFILNVKASNRQSIKTFSKVLKHFNSHSFFKFKYGIVTTTRNPAITRYTALTSPHVNKTAQEHFKKHIYKKDVAVFSLETLQFLIILKQIQLTLFSEIFITIQLLLKNNLISTKKKIKNTNPNCSNFVIDFLLVCHDITPKTYLKYVDVFGEISFKNYFT